MAKLKNSEEDLYSCHPISETSALVCNNFTISTLGKGRMTLVYRTRSYRNNSHTLDERLPYRA